MHPNYQISRFKTHGSGTDGRRYSFTILRDGKAIGTGAEDGDGAPVRWDFLSPADGDAMITATNEYYRVIRDADNAEMATLYGVPANAPVNAPANAPVACEWGLDYWVEEQVEAVGIAKDNATLRRRVARQTLVVAIGGTAAYQAGSRKGYRIFKGEPTPGNVQHITPLLARYGVTRFAFLTHALMDGEPLIEWQGMPGMARMEAIANGPAHPNLVVTS